MLRSFFFLFTAFGFQVELISEPDAPTHIITFNFDISKCNPKTIIKVELNRIKEDFSHFEIPVKTMVFGTNSASLSIVVGNLLSDKLCFTDFFHIIFYKEKKEDKESPIVAEYIFEINKKSNGRLKIYSKTLKGIFLYLDFVFNRYLEKIYEGDKKFLTVPKSNILCTKMFVVNHKDKLDNYFTRSKGLKQTVDSLNNCLSKIKEPKDIPVKIKNFFNERREALTKLNDSIARFEGKMKKFLFKVEDSLINMMVDVLILLEICTPFKSCFNYTFLPLNNISLSLKEVKEFPIPETLYKKKNSTILLRILPDGNLNSYFEKDLWFSINKLYVSRDLCDTCRDLNSSLEIFNFNDKKKSMTVELYKAWI